MALQTVLILTPVITANVAFKSGDRGAELASTNKNVLLLISDDLRADLAGAYGHPETHTPHLDKFAQESLTFDHAYCQVPWCSPSRNSFMASRRPDHHRVWASGDLRQFFPDAVTLPQLFKENGFITLGQGKTFHLDSPPNYDLPKSWSTTAPPGINTTYCSVPHCYDIPVLRCPPPWAPSSPWCATDEPLQAFGDYRNALFAVERLKQLAKYADGKRWFAAVGMHHPHLKWRVPKQYWGGDPRWPYPADNAEYTVPSQRTQSKNVSGIAFFSTELSTYEGVVRTPHRPFTINGTRELRHAYYAAVSMVDDMFGIVLDGLEATGQSNNTVVVVMADHGYMLGSHGAWCKVQLWEPAVRIPLLIRSPAHPQSYGRHTKSFTESIDLMPTLASLTGIPLSADESDGISQLATFYDVDTSVKGWALTQVPRCVKQGLPMWKDNVCSDALAFATSHYNFTAMGYSLRTSDWRLTAWLPWDSDREAARWDVPPFGVELYPHANDTGNAVSYDTLEHINLAGNPQYAGVVQTLTAKLKTIIGPPPPPRAHVPDPELRFSTNPSSTFAGGPNCTIDNPDPTGGFEISVIECMVVCTRVAGCTGFVKSDSSPSSPCRLHHCPPTLAPSQGTTAYVLTS